MSRLRPIVTRDTAWWVEAWARGELLIQCCDECKQLRHPPQPVCAACRSGAWTPVKASGRARLYSYVVTHYPAVEGFDHPFVLGLVELEEGTRLVSNIIGANNDDLYIGMPLQLEFVAVDAEMKLPQFAPAPVDD